jgi:signal peptidase I
MKEEKREEKKEEKKDLIVWLDESNLLFYIFIVFFILFLIFRNDVLLFSIFSILAGLSFISIFVVNIAAGIKKHGVVEEIKEIGKAAIFAILIMIILMIILGTNIVPVSAVMSCSLLPRFERGDMVIIQKVNMSELVAPEVEISKEEFDEIYFKQHEMCKENGVIEYVCGMCERLNSKTKEFVGYSICAREVKVKGISYFENFSNNVIVYQPTTFDGKKYNIDIIHRVFLKIKVNGRYYLLVKGDNNDAFDTVAYRLVGEENYRGKEIMRIPYLGYLKLFLSLSFSEPPGCEVIYAHNVKK